MSITGELREYADGWRDRSCGMHLHEIANRIDAAHENAVTAAHCNGITKYGSMVAREYVKLPVDADGVPIHVGDELTDEKGRPVKVRVLKLREDGWLFDSSPACGGMSTAPFHHVKPDSWERIIEDAQEYVTDDEPLYSVSELVERCRRLAGAE